MIIVVCGPRDWKDFRMVGRALNEVTARAKPNEPITVIQGGARGADFQAKSIAEINHWNGETFAPDEADGYPQKFFIRNQRMADYKPTPDACIAMVALCQKDKCENKPPHMTHGTADMIKRAVANKIPLYLYGEVDLYYV